MKFVLNKERNLRLPGFFLAVLMSLVLAVPSFAQFSGTEVQGESVCMRSVGNGRWVDQTTWQIYRSGLWVPAANGAGAIPDAGRNVFIETNHTVIATRAQVNTSGGSRDYNGNQSYAFVEVGDLHISTAGSVTTTWGVYPGRISGARTVAAGGAWPSPNAELAIQNDPATVLWANNSLAGGIFGNNTAVTRFSASPGVAVGGVVTAAAQFPYPVQDVYNGDRFGGHVRWESLEQFNSTPVGGLTAGRPDPDFAAYELDYSTGTAGGALTTVTGVVAISGCTGCPTGYDVDGEPMPRPRNNELRIYGKMRYYVGSALRRDDRAANIQVTAATIGTGSTIVFRGSSRWITQPNEWSTTLATKTGRYDNTAFGGMTAAGPGTGGHAALMGTTDLFGDNYGQLRAADNYRGLMGRNSFWTAIFDLGRLRDRQRGLTVTGDLKPGSPNKVDGSASDLFGGMNDYTEHAVGVLGGNFTAGIIQVRRGTVDFRGDALLANEGAATSGSIQVMNNSVLRISNPLAQIGRTAVSGRQFANGQADAQVNGVVSARSVSWAGNGGFMETPQGPYYVTSRMRYFVVEEGGALDFASQVGLEKADNGEWLTTLPQRANGQLDPSQGAPLGATLSAADVRFNGTVIYSRTGNQNLVQDSPFLAYTPASDPSSATSLGAAAGFYNIGENGVLDPYNNLRDPYNLGATGFTYSVGAAGVFAPATTAAYSHLTFRGTGNKFLIATTVVISRSLLMQGTARVKLSTGNAQGGDLSLGNLPQHMLQANGHGTADPAVSSLEAAVALGSSPAFVPTSGRFPALLFLRSTGLWGFREEFNIGTTFRQDLYGAAADADAAGAIAGNNGMLKNLQYSPDNNPVMPMWSAYGGNTDPVAFVGFTTASTSIIPMFGSTMSFPIGMVLSGSTNREQMDMTPWNKPSVIHGLPCEPSYVGVANVAVTPAAATHGWSARAVQYPNMDLSSNRWGQVIRQSVDRVNGVFTGTASSNSGGVMCQPFVGSMGNEQENIVAFSHVYPVGSVTTVQGIAFPTPATIGAGNFPVITNSLYDYAINTTATTTLQYDSEAGNVMSQAEFPNGVVGPHNLVMNMLNGDVNTLPVRTDNLFPYDGATDFGGRIVNVSTYFDVPVAGATSYRGRAVWGVTGGTIVIGPEYTNSLNGNLPRHAFTSDFNSKNAGMYQAGAFYDREDGRVFQTNPTSGVAASAYVDTRPDVADMRYKYGYLTYPGNQTVYNFAYGLRPSIELTGTFDGRVRVGLPRTYTNAPMIWQYATGFRTTDALGAIVATNDVNDFGRRGDFNNFGVVELRRGTLVIPQGTEGTNGIEARAFPGGTLPGTRDARLQPYTFTMVTVAIMSQDQAKVTYQGNPVGASSSVAKVCLSDDPDGGGGTLNAPVGAAGGPNGWGVRAPAARGGGLVIRGGAGPLNMSGSMHGGNFANLFFTGGTGGTIDNTAIRTAITAASPYFPPYYGGLTIGGLNNGLTELTPIVGVLGAVARQPVGGFVSYKDPTSTLGYQSGVYNPGPEMTSDYDATTFTMTYSDAVHRGGNNATAYASFQGAAQVAFTATNFSGNNQPGYGLANAQVERANNSYNIDLPYVRAGANHFTFMRSTWNVCTLVGNNTTDVQFNSTDNLTGISTNRPEESGLIINGTIATARGDIDLNGRNIELQGNLSYLHEAFFKAQFVDSATGRPLWSYPAQQYYPRNFSGGNFTAASPAVAFPTAPSSVRNSNRNVRAYIGTTSPRNINNDNSSGGVTESFDEIAGLGAKIYVSGNPMQVRVRRWQTRGNDIVNGNVTTRPNIFGADRYWQIETTGNQMLTAQSSKLRLQYIDTDLFNENGTTTGLAPASINIFRAVGTQIVPVNTIGATPNDRSPRSVTPFQALFAQERVGLASYNYEKQLTLSQVTQIVNGKEVLNTANFTVVDAASHNATGTDVNNPDGPKTGFQVWAIGVPSPKCITIRGQRFGGTYGDPIGVSTTGGATGVNLKGNMGSVNPAQYTQQPSLTGPNIYYNPENSGLLPANGGPAYGGVQAANSLVYGPVVGPFKAGISTVSTIIADLLDEFGNVATTDFTSGAILTVSSPNDGYAARYFQTTPYAVSGGAAASFGGRFEFPDVTLNGVHSTQLTISVVRTYGNTTGAPAGSNNMTPYPIVAGSADFCETPAAGIKVSLQGGLPFSVTFATVSGTENQRPSRYMGVGKVSAPNSNQIAAIGQQKNIVVGQDVNLGNTLGSPNFNAITVIVRDRFGNLASVPTRATITLGGGNPPINPIYTVPVNNVIAYSNIQWGLGQDGLEASGSPKTTATPPIARVFGDAGAPVPTYPFTQWNPNSASFNAYLHRAFYSTPNPGINNPQVWTHFASFGGGPTPGGPGTFQVWGATSNNVNLVVSIQSETGGVVNANTPVYTLGNSTVATVNIINNQAAAIAFEPTQPGILINDPVNPANLVRVPSQMFVGRVAPSFRVAAVDAFGNVASGDPDDMTPWTQAGAYTANNYPYVGNTATITFPAPGTSKVTLSNGTCAATTDQLVAGVQVPSRGVTAPTQQYSAQSGNTARAGLFADGSKGYPGIFVFDQFKPAGPASPTNIANDVLLCFSDPNLPGTSLGSGTGVVPPTTTPSGQVYPYPNAVNGGYPFWGVMPPVTTANTTWLNIPVVSISSAVSSANEGGGADTISTDPNISSLNLLERKVTFGGIIGEIQQKSNAGNLIVSRPVGSTVYPATIGYTLSYADKNGKDAPNSDYPATTMTLPAPLPAPLASAVSYTTLSPAPGQVSINTLEGDLRPRTTPAGGTEQVVKIQTASDVGSISLPAGTTSQAMSFTARYSDQVYPRTPGLQGKRKATVTLLDYPDNAPSLSGPYALGTKKTGTVTLDDPKNLAPVILNAIQDKQFTRTQNDVIELETTGARADGLPNTVFYDDNYDGMTYTVESSDKTVIDAEVKQSDDRFGGRPSLTIRTQSTSQPNQKATIKITANDGRGGTNTDEFVVTIVSSVTASTPVDPSAVSLNVSPNPTTDRVTVEAQAKKTGTVRIKLVNLLGAEVNSVELNVTAGQGYSHVFNLANLSAGTYKVVINDGDVVTSKNLQVTK